MAEPTLDERRTELEREIAALQPDPLLVKIFAALFDDGQGDNARRALIKRCQQSITVVPAASLEGRMWRMILRQQQMLDEAAFLHATLKRVTPDAV